VAIDEGIHQTLVDGVEVVGKSESAARAPEVYLPKILIVGQGSTRAYPGRVG